jgi:hypothetical protein
MLKKLKDWAKKLNLKFDKSWFDYTWITKEQEVLTAYLARCPDPIYEKYGHDSHERITNLEKFYNSQDYKNCIKRYGGQMISEKSFRYYKTFISKIKNRDINKILLDFCHRIDKKIGNVEKIAVLTETKDKTEKKLLLDEVLRHEWIHVLLEQNNLRAKNWKYNEGLVTYIDYLMKERLNDLEEHEKRANCNFQREYFTNAIIFRDLLKEIKDEGKIRKIKEFLKIK